MIFTDQFKDLQSANVTCLKTNSFREGLFLKVFYQPWADPVVFQDIIADPEDQNFLTLHLFDFHLPMLRMSSPFEL